MTNEDQERMKMTASQRNKERLKKKRKKKKKIKKKMTKHKKESLFLLNGISNFVGYAMPKPSL